MSERLWQQEVRPSNYSLPDTVRDLQVGDHTSITVQAKSLEHLEDGLETTRNHIKSVIGRISRQTDRKFVSRVFRSVLKDTAIGGIVIMRTE